MTVITIGYNLFAVKKASDAATLIRIMADAMPLERDFINGRDWFFPANEKRHNEVSMTIVPDTQFLLQKPVVGEAPETYQPTPRRRGLRLTGPSIKTPEAS